MGRAGRRGLSDALCWAPGAGKGGDCWWGEGWPLGAAQGPHLHFGILVEGWGLPSRTGEAQRPVHTHGRLTAGGPLFRDALRKCASANVGCSGQRGAARPFGELPGALSGPLAALHTPTSRMGVCPSGGASVKLGVSSCACCCVSECPLFVCPCAFPLCVLTSLGVSPRLGPSVFAVGVGVCEHPLRVLESEYCCLWILLFGSVCIFGFCVRLSSLCACLCICECVCAFGLCLCFLAIPVGLVPVCACPSLGGCASSCVI